ncbi:hypothetical protein [Spongiimicrobium salis]|uniref:hypothetical protein n=1 Tax=Spongiimicrobium salis TaxID=1667022 RepID=UPI00374D2D77
MGLPEKRALAKEMGIKVSPGDTIKQLDKKIKAKTMAKETQEGNITPEQIAEWKKKHGKVHKLTVVVNKDDEGKAIDTAIGYLKEPSRNHKATAMSMYSQNKVLECGEFLRNNCWLGGDERLKSSGNIADTAAIQANGIIQFLEGDLGEA